MEIKTVKMDINTPEWVQDFEIKKQMLGQRYMATEAQEIYNIIFGDLTKERPLFLRDIKKPIIAKGYKDILKYIEEYDTVFVYLQEFRKSYSRAHSSIDSMYALVVDLDGVRAHNLHEVIELVEKAPLKPNLIVSSGNGVHLYYLLKEPFPFYCFTYVSAIASYDANIQLSRKGAFKVIKEIHKAICSWYRKPDQDYKIDVLHLSQPLRMCGAKTKNPEYRTEGFMVTDHRVDMEELAELVGVKLVDEEIVPFLKARDPQFIEEHAAYLKEMELAAKKEDADRKRNTEMARASFRGYRANREAFIEKMKQVFGRETNTTQGGNNGEMEVVDEVPRQTQKLRYQRESQGRRSFDLFTETAKKIGDGAKPGNRHNLLHILCSRGGMYRIPIEQLTKTVHKMAEHFTTIDPTDPISDDDIRSALTAYEKRWKYRNSYVLEKTGVDLSMENKKTLERAASRVKKSERNSNVVEIAKFIFEEAPKTSLRQFYKILTEDYSMDVSRSWVVGNEAIKEIKAGYQAI